MKTSSFNSLLSSLGTLSDKQLTMLGSGLKSRDQIQAIFTQIEKRLVEAALP